MNARLDVLVIVLVRLDLEHIQFNERASGLFGNFACLPGCRSFKVRMPEGSRVRADLCKVFLREASQFQGENARG